jgi:putative membrane protein insertion efficiency factor
VAPSPPEVSNHRKQEVITNMPESANLRFSQRLLLRLLGVYQSLVSPLLPNACRFHPSCSCYAQDAIVEHGVLRGGLLAIARVSRCHPLSGGFDPVPPRRGHDTVLKGSE